MSVIKCHQQFRAAAKCSGSPTQACLPRGAGSAFWDGRDVHQPQTEATKLRKVGEADGSAA